MSDRHRLTAAKGKGEAFLSSTPRQYRAEDRQGLCRICGRDKAVNRMRYESLTGEVELDLCWPCTGSRPVFAWGKGYVLNGDSITASEIFERLPKDKKCAECGGAIRGAHWHFSMGKDGTGHAPDKGGRVYYCDAECCPHDNCPTGRLMERVAQGDEDEFVFGDDDDEDEFVFGDDDDEDEEWEWEEDDFEWDDDEDEDKDEEFVFD